jgi:signal transduction histidine kinase/DNA-binding response OmpR family regulator
VTLPELNAPVTELGARPAGARVLVVDDDERTLEAVATVLQSLGQTLVIAHSGEEALRQVLFHDFAVILLDVQMPGMDGYEVASFIRARRKTRHIPIVFLTAVYRDDIHLLQAYSAGAVDMIFKPVDPFILKSKVAVFVDLYLKQVEIERQAELRLALQKENLSVRLEKLSIEEALRKSNQREEAILRAVPLCCLSRGAEPPHPITFIGQSIERMTGFSPDRFLQDAKFASSRIHPDDRRSAKAALKDILSARAYSWEFRWRCADDCYRVFLDQGIVSDPVDGGPPELVGTLVDITEQRILQQQLNQAQKMEAVGRLTGGIAHDFNNLLTVVLGNLDLLQPKLADNARITRHLSAMRHAAQRGRSLTGQLLAFSRRQHLEPELFDLCTRVQGFAELLKHALGEQVELRLVLGDEPLACELDPAQLETSLLNLAVNARDAMPHGGTFTIEVGSTGSNEPPLAGVATPLAGWIAIKACDTGIGMARDTVTRAFEPFFTTKEVGRGSGLGLSQVYGFVNQSGGAVSLASALGEGTMVSIHLPRSSKPLPEPAPDDLNPVSESGEGETVLIVEDDAHVRELGREMLDDLGYTVIHASDANMAIAILRDAEKVDLLLTDVIMPGGKTGVELAQEARRLRPGIKILLTSGYTGEAIDRHGLGALDLPFISKPFERSLLSTKLRSVLGGRADAAQCGNRAG